MQKLIHVVGARPNFMKVAPIMEALSRRSRAVSHDLQQLLVHTGQHYSQEMSDLFFKELELPTPDINLEVGSGPHGQQTGRIMEAFERVLFEQQPDAVLVVGDVNSTIACALDAKKLGIDVIHVEAGLRSRDIRMPEEVNRILTDAISDMLFTTEESARDNLIAEGIADDKIFFVGNVMIDTLLRHKAKALERPTLNSFGLAQGDYCLMTFHRPSNVDNPEVLNEIVAAMQDIAKQMKVFLPLHPRTQANLEKFELMSKVAGNPNITIAEPQGYLDFLNCTANAQVVVTDSGGIQEETTILKVPCLTVRENTERPITITEGTNRLVDSTCESILNEFSDVVANYSAADAAIPKLWDGSASDRIAELLLR